MYETIRKLKKINKNQSKDWTDELIDINRKMKDAINLGAVRSNLEFDIMHREFKKIYSNLPESVDAEIFMDLFNNHLSIQNESTIKCIFEKLKYQGRQVSILGRKYVSHYSVKNTNSYVDYDYTIETSRNIKYNLLEDLIIKLLREDNNEKK